MATRSSFRASAAAVLAAASLALTPAHGAAPSKATTVRTFERAIKAAVVRLADVSEKAPVTRIDTTPIPHVAAPVPAGVPVQRIEPGKAATTATTPGTAKSTTSNDSPAPSASFVAVEDNDSAVPPDTTGAAGPDHLMAVTNARLRVQTKTGALVESAAFAAFWEPLGVTDPFGPRLVYEPYGRRWILVAAAGKQSSTSAVLLAVSQTSDPSGLWNLYAFDADPNNTTWADHPIPGFDRDRIVIQSNMGRNDTNSALAATKIWAIGKLQPYNGGIPQATVFTNAGSTLGNTQVPAVTYDQNLAVTHFLSDWNGPTGTMRLFTLQGPVGQETFTAGAFVTVTDPWDDGPPSGADYAPQAAATRKIHAGDARVANLVYRNGSLWAAHTVFLPAGGTPSRSAIQWWEIRPDATVLQRGRVDDGPGARYFAFPSIAVNNNGDALLGFSRFSATSFAGAGYVFRFGTDAASTMRTDRLLKGGEAKYERGQPRNMWGITSATVSDPSDDRSLWTVQEFAWTPNVLHDRWSTWWGKVVSTAVPGRSVSPTSITFANQNVATRSAERTVTVTNTGTANLLVQSLTMTGSHPADFAVGSDGCTGAPVAPGASCTLGVSFTPAAPEPRGATLEIGTNVPGAPATVALTGTGTTPSGAITFEPASLAFGGIEVGQTSGPLPILVRNSGTAPAVIGQVVIGGAVPGDFSIVSNGCASMTLHPGGGCNVEIRFTPGAGGARNANVQVTSNAPGGPHTAPLSGTGIVLAPQLTRSTSNLNFGQQTVGTTSVPKEVTIFNTGNSPLQIGLISISGNNASDYIKTGDTCSSASLAPGGSCVVAVAFSPSVAGTRTAGMGIPSNAFDSPHLVTLAGSGGGGEAPRIGFSPSSISFGEVGVGLTSPSQTLTITNEGTVQVTISPLGLWGSAGADYAKTADQCTNTALAPGASCTVKIAFAPTQLGLRSAALSVPSNANGSPHSVSLSGSGADRIAPRTQIMTREGAVLVGGPVVVTSMQTVQGRTTDDLSGVKRVAVTFTPALGSPDTVVVSLQCTVTIRGCSWNARVPLLPGVYDVTTEATDYAGNVETDGPTISVIVL